MTAKWKFPLLLVVLFLAAFSISTALAKPSGKRGFHQAMELVASDPARLVCSARGCMRPEAAHTLLVFFSPADCAIGLYQTAVLDSLFRAAAPAELRVLGVAEGMGVAEVRKFVTASGITYPVYADHERFESVFGHEKSADVNAPVLLLLDRRGKVLDRSIAGGSVRSHHAYMARVARLWTGAP